MRHITFCLITFTFVQLCHTYCITESETTVGLEEGNLFSNKEQLEGLDQSK